MRGRALLTALLLTAPARASVLDIYGFNPRGTAMGNAQAAVADDYTAAFYNPAGLTRRKKVGVGAGFVATFPRLTLDRDYAGPPEAYVDHELPPAFSGFNLGMLFPLGGLIDNRVAVALTAYLPTVNLLRGEGVDPQVPQFYRYQNLPDKFVVLAAGAFEITPWLSVGGGVQVLASLDGAVDVHLELANRRVRSQAVEVEISPAAAAVAGLLVRPLEGLDVGFSYRQAIQLDFALPTSIVIDQLVDLNIDIRGTVLYSPHYLNLGAAYDIAPANLLLSGELGYAFWSLAPDPSPTFTIDIGGELAEGLGLGERLDVGNGAPVELNFRDVPLVRLGLEHRPHEVVRLRAGYTWRPSPAPVPTGAFNYVDNDAHLLALGAGVTFADPLEVRQNPVTFDVVYQATLMADQPVEKSLGAADPVGDYTAGGVIHSVGIAFRHDL